MRQIDRQNLVIEREKDEGKRKRENKKQERKKDIVRQTGRKRAR